MLTIILGFVIVFVLNAILGHENNLFNNIIAFLISEIIIAATIIPGIFFALSGFNDWEFQNEIELVSLSNSVETSIGHLYAVRSSDNVYLYRYKIDSEFGTPTSTNYTTSIVKGNVEEIEDPKCEIPVLRIYKRTAKASIWTFALSGEDTKYVFYVPEGTIQKEVKLK